MKKEIEEKNWHVIVINGTTAYPVRCPGKESLSDYMPIPPKIEMLGPFNSRQAAREAIADGGWDYCGAFEGSSGMGWDTVGEVAVDWTVNVIKDDNFEFDFKW